MSEIDDSEDLVVDSEVNLTTLREKNELSEILSRDSYKQTSSLDDSITCAEKPEFCNQKCKNCKAEAKYSLLEIKFNSKIGKFLNFIFKLKLN